MMVPRFTKENEKVASAAISALNDYASVKGIPVPDYSFATSPPFWALLLVSLKCTFDGYEFQCEGFTSKTEAKRVVALAAVEHFRKEGIQYFEKIATAREYPPPDRGSAHVPLHPSAPVPPKPSMHDLQRHPPVEYRQSHQLAPWHQEHRHQPPIRPHPSYQPVRDPSVFLTPQHFKAPPIVKPGDYISQLQTYATMLKGNQPNYNIVLTGGVSHLPEFHATVEVNGLVVHTTHPHQSKKAAKSAVAALALARLREEHSKTGQPFPLAQPISYNPHSQRVPGERLFQHDESTALVVRKDPSPSSRQDTFSPLTSIKTEPNISFTNIQMEPVSPEPLPLDRSHPTLPAHPPPPNSWSETSYSNAPSGPPTTTTADESPSNLVHNLLSTLVWNHSHKRVRSESGTSEVEASPEKSSDHGRFPTYSGLLGIECFRRRISSPAFQNVLEDGGGFRCQTSVFGRSFRSMRIHENAASAQEDVAGDVYKWLLEQDSAGAP
ncbi:hypothetical protein HKX48_006883 [Thoreauomyces humboldtii]|nr:hypothetical protein HKX48_006883 [Thoreauomyces humboldtii]